MFLPVVDVNIGDTTDQKLQFSFIEDIDEFCWYQLVESCNKCIELFFDSFLDSPFRDKTSKEVSQAP